MVGEAKEWIRPVHACGSVATCPPLLKDQHLDHDRYVGGAVSAWAPRPAIASWLRPPRHQWFLPKIFASPCNFDGLKPQDTVNLLEISTHLTDRRHAPCWCAGGTTFISALAGTPMALSSGHEAPCPVPWPNNPLLPMGVLLCRTVGWL